MIRIQVHDHKDLVLLIIGPLPVGNHLIVVGVDKSDILVGTERRLLPPHFVQFCQEGGNAAGLVEVPILQLVLLAIEILFPPCQRLVLTQFVAAVDAP